MKFGKYAIIDKVEHHFEKEPDWVWWIEPPTSGDELNMQKFTVNNRVEQGPDGVRHEYPLTLVEIAHREIALTFGGTNIPDDDGKPILGENAPVGAIETVLKQMPHDLVMEIWKAIGEAVPGWGMAPKVQPEPMP